MDVLMSLLIIAAVLAGAAGLLFTSEATLGVGLIAVGCLFGILARIAQAAHHRNAAQPAVPVPVAEVSPAERDAMMRTEKHHIALALVGVGVLFALFVISRLLE